MGNIDDFMLAVRCFRVLADDRFTVRTYPLPDGRALLTFSKRTWRTELVLFRQSYRTALSPAANARAWYVSACRKAGTTPLTGVAVQGKRGRWFYRTDDSRGTLRVGDEVGQALNTIQGVTA